MVRLTLPTTYTVTDWQVANNSFKSSLVHFVLADRSIPLGTYLETALCHSRQTKVEPMESFNPPSDYTVWTDFDAPNMDAFEARITIKGRAEAMAQAQGDVQKDWNIRVNVLETTLDRLYLPAVVCQMEYGGQEFSVLLNAADPLQATVANAPVDKKKVALENRFRTLMKARWTPAKLCAMAVLFTFATRNNTDLVWYALPILLAGGFVMGLYLKREQEKVRKRSEERKDAALTRTRLANGMDPLSSAEADPSKSYQNLPSYQPNFALCQMIFLAGAVFAVWGGVYTLLGSYINFF